jgi:hypothetical protein
MVISLYESQSLESSHLHFPARWTACLSAMTDSHKEKVKYIGIAWRLCKNKRPQWDRNSSLRRDKDPATSMVESHDTLHIGYELDWCSPMMCFVPLWRQRNERQLQWSSRQKRGHRGRHFNLFIRGRFMIKPANPCLHEIEIWMPLRLVFAVRESSMWLSTTVGEDLIPLQRVSAEYRLARATAPSQPI